MKYCIDCWEKFEGVTVCPQCGAKLYDCNDWGRFKVQGGLITECYISDIPYGVRTMGSNCLGYGARVTEMVLPNTVKFILDRAFTRSDLRTISIPSSVTHIGYEAFYGCVLLNSVTLLGIKYIGKSAFAGCRDLTSVTIGAGVVSIGEYAFSRCYNLRSIKFCGTKAQWAAVKKGGSWAYDEADKTVICSDGTVTVNRK